MKEMSAKRIRTCIIHTHSETCIPGNRTMDRLALKVQQTNALRITAYHCDHLVQPGATPSNKSFISFQYCSLASMPAFDDMNTLGPALGTQSPQYWGASADVQLSRVTCFGA